MSPVLSTHNIWKQSYWSISVIPLRFPQPLHFPFFPSQTNHWHWWPAVFREPRLSFLILWGSSLNGCWLCYIGSALAPQWIICITYWCSIWKFKCPVNQSLKKDCSILQVATICKEISFISCKWAQVLKMLLISWNHLLTQGCYLLIFSNYEWYTAKSHPSWSLPFETH